MRILEKRLKDAAAEQSEVGKRIKYMEGMQLDLVQSFEEVRSSTGDLEKTAAIWLPKYEAAARIVNELSSKVERMDEKFHGICCDAELTQQIDRVAETKVQSLREMLASDSLKDMGSQMKDLYARVENGDRGHCQVPTTFRRSKSVACFLLHSESPDAEPFLTNACFINC